MSIMANIRGGLVISDPIELTTTSLTDIYVATDKDTIVATMSVVNTGASNAKVTIYRNDGTNDLAIWCNTLAPGSTEIISQIPVRLYTGEKLVAQSDQAGDITITPNVIRIGSYEAHNSSAATG